MSFRSAWSFVLVLVLLGGCAYRGDPIHVASDSRHELLNASRLHNLGVRQPDLNERLALFLLAGEMALKVVEENPASDGKMLSRAWQLYNSSCELALTALEGPPHAWMRRQELASVTTGDRILFEIQADPKAAQILNDADRIASTSEFRRVKAAHRFDRDGVGGALLALRAKNPERSDLKYAPRGGVATPLSSTLSFSRKNGGLVAIATVHDSSHVHSVTIQGSRRPLRASKLPAPAAFGYHIAYRTIELLGVFLPERLSTPPRLFLGDEFDPEKIPVVLVHGLQSSPQVWFPLANELSLTQDIGSKYQFYYYFYETGLPMSYSASWLRRHLREATEWMHQEGRTHSREMLVVGHSMGGMLTRMQVIDPGRELLDAVFEDEAEFVLAQPESNPIRQALVFSPNKDISRVVFMATPHRGAPMASGWIGRIVRSLIRLPGSLLDEITTLANPFEQSDFLLRLRVNSIFSLSPNNPLTSKWDDFPLLAPYHSIIGRHRMQRDGTFSDGVVPYKSAHLPGAVSELIINSNHMVPLRKEAIEEMKRILLLHSPKD